MTKLSDFLEKNKINQERLIGASHDIEKLRGEDYKVRLAQRRVRGGKATDAEKELAAQKRRSGKPVTRPTLDAALRGDKIHRKARQRIVAAVNKVLGERKKSQVEASDLF